MIEAINNVPLNNMWNTINNLNMQNMLRDNNDDATTSTMSVNDATAMTMTIIFFVLIVAGIAFLIFWVRDDECRPWPIMVAAFLIAAAICIPIALLI